jgi:hypothetical protein
VRYHVGTAAFGSSVIAIMRAVRVSFEFLKARLKSKRTVQNWLCKLPMCIASCALWFLEKILKFLNKHAYIQCAFFGTSFFTSARFAFKLIVRNLGRTAAVSVVSDLVVLVGKLLITLICSIAAYYYMTHHMKNELNGFVLQTLLVAFLAFFTATLFLGVLSGAADTLLQASIVEEEIHKADELRNGNNNNSNNSSNNSNSSSQKQQYVSEEHQNQNRAMYQRHVQQHRGLHLLVVEHAKEWRSGERDEEDEAEMYDVVGSTSTSRDRDVEATAGRNSSSSSSSSSVEMVARAQSTRSPVPVAPPSTSSSERAKSARLSGEAPAYGRKFGQWSSSRL